MDKIVLEAVQAEAKKIGIIDPDVCRLFDLSELHAVNGRVDPTAIKNLLSVQVVLKPGLFSESAKLRLSDASRLNDRDLGALTDELTKSTYARKELPAELKRIDAAKLDENELHALTAVLESNASSLERATVEEAAKRQGLELSFAGAR
jgi:hypothetical protein